jgi:hypothetical protein
LARRWQIGCLRVTKERGDCSADTWHPKSSAKQRVTLCVLQK